MLRLQQVDVGLDRTVDIGCNLTVERDGARLHRTHLQTDVIGAGQRFAAIDGEIYVEGPPAGVGSDESVAAQASHPGSDIL